jgi:hypothetical protein
VIHEAAEEEEPQSPDAIGIAQCRRKGVIARIGHGDDDSVRSIVCSDKKTGFAGRRVHHRIGARFAYGQTDVEELIVREAAIARKSDNAAARLCDGRGGAAEANGDGSAFDGPLAIVRRCGHGLLVPAERENNAEVSCRSGGRSAKTGFQRVVFRRIHVENFAQPCDFEDFRQVRAETRQDDGAVFFPNALQG